MEWINDWLEGDDRRRLVVTRQSKELYIAQIEIWFEDEDRWVGDTGAEGETVIGALANLNATLLDMIAEREGQRFTGEW